MQIREAEIINERRRVQQGEERRRKGILKGKRARGEEGRKGWSGRVPLESFLLLAGLNRGLLSPENTHSGPFLVRSPSLAPLPLLIPLF